MNKNQETSKYFGQLQIQSQFKNHYARLIINTTLYHSSKISLKESEINIVYT